MNDTTQAEARPKPRGFNERTGRCMHALKEPMCADCWPRPAPPPPPARCERCGSVKDCAEHTPEVCDSGHALLEGIAEAARERPPISVPKAVLKLREPQPPPRAAVQAAPFGSKAKARPAAPTTKPAALAVTPAFPSAAPPANGERTAEVTPPLRSAGELLKLHLSGRLRGTNGETLDPEAVTLLERAAATEVETAPPPPEAPDDWQARCKPVVAAPADAPTPAPTGRRGPKVPHLPLCPYCAALPPTAVLVQFCNHDKTRAKARLRGRNVEHTEAAVLAELRRCVNRDTEPGDPVEMSKRSLALRLTPQTVAHVDRLTGTGLGATREAVVESLLTFALSALVFTGAGMDRSTVQ